MCTSKSSIPATFSPNVSKPNTMAHRSRYPLLVPRMLRMLGMLVMLFATSVTTAIAADVAPPVTGLANRPQKEERLSFQTQEPYRPRVHLNADVAMVYGIDKTMPDRIKTWRDQGYILHVMTGAA